MKTCRTHTVNPKERESEMEKIETEEEIGFMNLDGTDFRALTRPEQIRHLEVEGTLCSQNSLIPNELSESRRSWSTRK